MRRFVASVSFLGYAFALCCTIVFLTGSKASSAAKAEQAKAHEQVSAQTADPKLDDHSYREDFSILPVSQNSLKTTAEILGERDDKPRMPFIRERWHLMWRPADPIDVYVVKPRNVKKPPVILYLYSWPQDTDRFKEDYWCGQTSTDGFAAVGFVSAVTGHRTEYRAPKDDFFNQLPESLGASVHDVQMILDFVGAKYDFDMSRIGMFGQGSGGAIAILASAVDPRIKALDVLTPWGGWPVFLEKSTFVTSDERPAVSTPKFLESVTGLDPLQWFGKVKAQSVRIQDVRGDRHMPDEAQEQLEGAAPDIAEIDQFGDGAAFVPAAANGMLLHWLRSQLQPDAKSQVAMEKSQRVHYFPPRAETNPLGERH